MMMKIPKPTFQLFNRSWKSLNLVWLLQLHGLEYLSMEFSRQEYWSGLPFLLPVHLPNPGTEPGVSCITGRFFTIWATIDAHLSDDFLQIWKVTKCNTSQMLLCMKWAKHFLCRLPNFSNTLKEANMAIKLIWRNLVMRKGFPGGSVVKSPPAMQKLQETEVQSLVGKIPWRRAWQSTLVLLPAESHGQRILVGNSSCGHKESGTTAVTWHTCTDEKSYKHIEYHKTSHLQSKDSNSGPMTLNLKNLPTTKHYFHF